MDHSPRALPPLIMSELTNITAIFHKASGVFGLIRAKPRDVDLQQLNETLAVCTLSITLIVTTNGCASDVVLPNAVYQTNHGGPSISCVTRAPTTTRTSNNF